MERFAENFRGGIRRTSCPLCGSHEDSQRESFKCKIITAEIDVQGKYEDLFNEVDNYPDLIKTVTKISQLRKQKLNEA